MTNKQYEIAKTVKKNQKKEELDSYNYFSYMACAFIIDSYIFPLPLVVCH